LGRWTPKAIRQQLNQKGTVSVDPEKKSRVPVGRLPVGLQVMVTWASGVMPSRLSLIDPEMSLVDMRLGHVSEQTVGSDVSETRKPLARATRSTFLGRWTRPL